MRRAMLLKRLDVLLDSFKDSPRAKEQQADMMRTIDAKLKAMPAKLKSDDGRHVVIRPLAYCKESDIADYAQAMAFPIIPCNLCGTQENLQRQEIKMMLRGWEKQYPGRTETIFRALGNVAPSHLMDHELYHPQTSKKKNSK